MKIGILQLRGAGDCIIAMPIAKWFYDQGHEIYWAIDNVFIEAFTYAFPYVNFIGFTPITEKDVQGNIRSKFWYETPKAKFDELGIDQIINFCYEEVKYANQLLDLEHRRQDPLTIQAQQCFLPFTKKFDEFKYHMTGVPFAKKWDLVINRNSKKEKDLFDKVISNPDKPYIVTHLEGGMGRFKLNLEKEQALQLSNLDDAEIIQINAITDNIFDWSLVLEKCHCFIGMDSFFVNYVDQMLFPIPIKHFIRRSNLEFTPVLGTVWNNVPINLGNENTTNTMLYK
jgi:hypothetical protein